MRSTTENSGNRDLKEGECFLSSQRLHQLKNILLLKSYAMTIVSTRLFFVYLYIKLTTIPYSIFSILNPGDLIEKRLKKWSNLFIGMMHNKIERYERSLWRLDTIVNMSEHKNSQPSWLNFHKASFGSGAWHTNPRNTFMRYEKCVQPAVIHNTLLCVCSTFMCVFAEV